MNGLAFIPKKQSHKSVAATTGVLQRKCACGPAGECENCRRKGEGALQRRTATQPSTFNFQASEVPPIVHEVLRSPGQPLDRATRAFMEPRFGHDFSNVRLHTDAKAAESAHAVSAQAYTVGRDVVFDTGQYAPNTTAGRQLLAHELTHVVQQHSQPGAPSHGFVSSEDDPHEREASRVADTFALSGVTRLGPFMAVSADSGLLQRNGEEDGRQRSRSSRPRNAPRGTVPIDQSELDREDVHKIKDGIGAGPRDWVGITPEGEVITTDAEGDAENHGQASDYLRVAHPEIPGWVWQLVGFFVVVAIIACFATGVCEVAAVVGGLGYAAAMLIMGLLKSGGVRDSGAVAAAGPDEEENPTV